MPLEGPCLYLTLIGSVHPTTLVVVLTFPNPADINGLGNISNPESTPAPPELYSLSCDVLNCPAPPCVYYYALRKGRDLRHIQNTDKIIMGFKLFLLVLSHAFHLIDNNFLHKLIDDYWGQFLYIGVFFDRPQETGRAVSVLLFHVNLRLQGGDFLFQRNLLLVITLYQLILM